MTNGSAYPEFQERDDVEVGTWDVRPSITPRTDLVNRIMAVPLGTDPNSRAIRNRETMRAKVSPQELYIPIDLPPSFPLMDACETVRLNALLKHQGVTHDADSIDARGLSAMVDRALASRDVNTLVDLTIRHYGTKAGKSVSRAIKDASDKHGLPQANEYFKGLRRVLRDNCGNWSYSYYRRYLSDNDPSSLASHGHDDVVTIPHGYRYTTGLAAAVNRFLERGADPTAEVKPNEVPGDLPEAGDMPTDFAPLRLQHLPKPERVAGRMGRKRSATNIGVNPRRIHRYLVDPEKRIFDRRIRGIGGVVLIDQSGSMHLSTDEIWDIINASPGATIIGYSHSDGAPHNCWVLAENGKVVSEVRDGNGGNGVDGPALLYALSKRKKGDPLVWVCDGHVTGRYDLHTRELAKWCAQVVSKYNVHMCEDVPEAVEALKQVRDGRKLPMRMVGAVKSAGLRLAHA
jgi:hypothetical protein